MTLVYDVPATPLIQNLAGRLSQEPAIKRPEWAQFAKTGVHREKAPRDANWWNVRLAAVLRKVYAEGPIGAERLRAAYGGPRDRGAAPNRAKSGSGSVAREALQQLEAAGLVEPVKGQGRRVTAKGRKLCDAAAHEVAGKLVETIPGLAKY
ncbi:MAG TPA: 30S ribosomal protein S19e [Candidatus Thermoplasmatota archaeon]|nr:30S ribosomal protein S19e [Candidatus Thermoplasmatota archaeon]